jgi:hypothetical protein
VNIFTTKLKTGMIHLPIIGMVFIIAVTLAVAFGPRVGLNLGQLGQRQAEQESQAQVGTVDTDGDGFRDEIERNVPCITASPGPGEPPSNKCIGTDPNKACATNDPGGPPSPTWPLDLKTGGSFNFNKVNVADLATFTAPIRRLDTTVGDEDYHPRWDLDLSTRIDVIDMAKLTTGITGYPPIYNGERAFGNSKPCKELSAP